MKTIRLLLASLPFVWLLGLASGCSKEVRDDQKGQEEQAIANVTLGVANGELRDGTLFSGDAQIKKLRVMIFRGVVLDTQKVFEGASLASVVKLEARVGTGRRVVAIANEPAALTPSLDNVLFDHQLPTLVLPEVNQSQDIPLIMFGEKTGVDIPESGNAQVEVSLNRVVAKISLKIKQATPAADIVEVTSAAIFRNAKHSSLLPLGSVVDKSALWEWKSSPLSLTLTNNGAPEQIIPDNSLYVYENLATAPLDTVGRAPILMVTALYNGIESAYYAYINDAPGEKQYQIERNHHYQLEGTITKIGAYNGLLLQTKVLPWDKEELSYDFLKPYLAELKPAGLETGVQTVTTNTPLEFKIKIKALEGDRWRATLSDGLHFRLEGTTEGLADGVTEYTVRVLANQAGGSEARHAFVAFTVNGRYVVFGNNTDKRAQIKVVQPVG